MSGFSSSSSMSIDPSGFCNGLDNHSFCYCLLPHRSSVVLFVGAMSGKGQKSSVQEYIAASESLGFLVTYFMMGGASFSAFAFLGGPGWAYSKGAPAFFILAYCALGLVPWWLWGGPNLPGREKISLCNPSSTANGSVSI